MASVWKRLQRVNKRAAKFQYTASYHRIDLDTTTKWKPNKLSVVWCRRSRRVITEPLDWEPSLKDPLKGSVLWPVPDNKTVTVTLFKDSRTNELEDKDWTFVLEDVSLTGKRRRLATCAVNMRKYASLEPTQRTLDLTLDPLTQKIVCARLSLTLHCVLLREGQATDEDMQSLASLLSVNNVSDIAQLDDLDDDDFSMSDNSASLRQMLNLTQQMEQMTNSLTMSELAATPLSLSSLTFDNLSTPTAPKTPLTPTPQNPNPSLGPDTADPAYLSPDLIRHPDSGKLEFTRFTDSATKKSDMTRFPDSAKKPDLTTRYPDFAPRKPDLMSNVPDPIKGGLEIDETSLMISENDAMSDFQFKNPVFQPRRLSKNSLKPLDLKSNLTSMDLNDNVDENSPIDEKTPIIDRHKFAMKYERDKTPVQDLLDWCKDVTSEYRQCNVTNLTTSWRNGIAFCAIIHHFRPDLIDFSGLQPDDAEQNLRIAFEASAKLGISQVLTAADVCNKPVPDRLAVMTHLFQLRAHFTGAELHVEQLGCTPGESSYMVGRHDTDSALDADLFTREIASARNNRHGLSHCASLSSQESGESQHSQDREPTPEIQRNLSPTSLKEVKGLFLAQSRTIIGRIMSPTRDKETREGSREKLSREGSQEKATKWFTDPLNATKNSAEVKLVRPIKLMTRKQLTDPFGSDEDDEELRSLQGAVRSPVSERGNGEALSLKSPVTSLFKMADSKEAQSPTENLPKPPPQLLSRHDELKERARQLLEATKREARERDGNRRQSSREERPKENGVNGDVSPVKLTQEERQVQLRERARKLIADARAGIVSPTSPASPARLRHGTVEIISHQSITDEIAAAGGIEKLEGMLRRDSDSSDSRSDSQSPDGDGRSKSTSPSRRWAVDSPVQSRLEHVDGSSPARDGDVTDVELTESGSYIQSEMEALEREQHAIDDKAALLEKELRRVMESADNTEEEDRLMSQWFNLVNKKNALLRRQMQLNILEQEEDLSRKCNLLARELRLSLNVEEWRKTKGQKRRERLLLQELLAAVNERDRLVQEMDGQERAIEDDDEIEKKLSEVEIQRKNNCILT